MATTGLVGVITVYAGVKGFYCWAAGRSYFAGVLGLTATGMSAIEFEGGGK